MVRLKVFRDWAEDLILCLFQFHYGTIKSEEETLKLLNLQEFQFHYGTIKSKEATQEEKIDAHFNSTMVRLKVYG